MDQFLEMLTGETAIAMKKIDLSSLPDSLKSDKKHTSDIVIGVKIKNLAIYDTLMATLESSGVLEKKENYSLFLNELYFLRKDSLLYITKNQSIKDDFLNDIKVTNKDILKEANNKWFLLYADETFNSRPIESKSLISSVAKSIFNGEKVKLESATIHLETLTKDKKRIDGETIVLLKDKNSNSLWAMLEILKEVLYQAKIRFEPNFFEEEQPKKVKK
jgi:hypothetical protein